MSFHSTGEMLIRFIISYVNFWTTFLEERKRLNNVKLKFTVYYLKYRLILMVQYHNYRKSRKLCTATKVFLPLLKFCR